MPSAVDIERQCGVTKEGIECARALTCKRHSMSAKRAVVGRSMPYDMLLEASQRNAQETKEQSMYHRMDLLITKLISLTEDI
jgi:SAGA-associated factor 73